MTFIPHIHTHKHTYTHTPKKKDLIIAGTTLRESNPNIVFPDIFVGIHLTVKHSKSQT